MAPIPRNPKLLEKKLKSIHQPEARKRFEEKFIKTESCWLWQASARPAGYGQISLCRTVFDAHRASYQLYKGDVPWDSHVLHTCDNPACVNPAHLLLGDAAANMQDMAAKGRQKGPKGSAHWNAKLTAELAAEIRERYAKGHLSQAILAREYGISASTMCDLLAGKFWKTEVNT